MARFNPDQDRYNSVGQDTWAHPAEEQHWRDMQPGADEVPVRLLRCPLCHKTLSAMQDCGTCGDETDVERDGPDADGSCPPREGSFVPATTRQGPSSPSLVPVSLSAREEAA